MPSKSVASRIDELAQASIVVLHQGCAVGKFLAGLGAADREAVQRWINDSGYPHAAAIRLFDKLGFKIGESSLRRHRQGQCSCEKAGLR